MVPQTISHYRLIRKLGEGGMGEVYLAEDTLLGRKVAIKFLSSQSQAQEQFRKRLIREARAAAMLDHPNICSIYEVELKDDGSACIVMQYVEGETLAQKAGGLPLGLSESLGIAIQIAEALVEAHSHGIIHRDIKPQNIMISLRGQAKVLDFGLASVSREGYLGTPEDTGSLITDSEAILGTVPYMSPEQLRAEQLDGRSDVFSLGIVLYEILTGKQPFARPSKAETVAAILTQQPQPPRSQAPSIPVELEHILLKCLEKDREQRYQSAGELSARLTNLKRNLDSAPTERIALARPEPRRSLASGHLLGWALIPTLIMILGAIWIYVAHRREAQSSAIVKRNINSIAVLPFDNIGGNADIEYLADGLTDSLINNLSRLPDLKVIARSSTFRYKNQNPDPQSVGRDLQVQALLIGRLTQRNDRISFNIELVDIQDNRHAWGQQYDEALSDILIVQQRISEDVTSQLRSELNPDLRQRINKTFTQNPQAFQLYLKGRFYLDKRTEEDLKKANDCFTQAIEMDPNFSLAYAGLADYYGALSIFSLLPPKLAFPKAKAAALRALEADDSLAEAHSSLAYTLFSFEWDWAGAEREYKRAIELNQNYARAYQGYGLFLMAMGRLPEAIQACKRAQALDPLSLSVANTLGTALLFSRKYDQAIEHYRNLIEVDRNYAAAYRGLGHAYLQKGLFREAIAAFQQEIALSSKDAPIATAPLGYAYAVAGRKAEALKIIEQLKGQTKYRYVSPISVAVIYAGLQDRQHTFEWLEKAYEEHSNLLVTLKIEPAYDYLHSDSRFLDLSRRVGLPQ